VYVLLDRKLLISCGLMEKLLENYLSQKLENPQFSLFVGWWIKLDLKEYKEQFFGKTRLDKYVGFKYLLDKKRGQLTVKIVAYTQERDQGE
jgi:hypothetical protein